jgi:hypothetical protein
MLKNIKGIGIATAIASTSFLTASSAYSFGLVYDINQFNNVQGLVGVATNAAPINTATFAGGNGYGGLFTQNFLLLGATPTDTNIPTDSLRNNNSVATSQQLITLTAADIINGVGLSFRFGYNGNSTGVVGLSDNDNFAIALINITGGANGVGNFITRNAPIYSTNTAISTILTPVINLQPGTYRLRITVNENADDSDNSTAAGFNNIEIAPVPFEFSPVIGVGLLGLAWGANKLRKAVKK